MQTPVHIRILLIFHQFSQEKLHFYRQVLCHVKKHCNTNKEGALEADTVALFMAIMYNIDLEPLSDNSTSLMTDSTFTKNFNQVYRPQFYSMFVIKSGGKTLISISGY